MRIKNKYERWDKTIFETIEIKDSNLIAEKKIEYFAHLEIKNGRINLEMSTNKFLDTEYISACREMERKNNFKTWGKAHRYLKSMGFVQMVNEKR